MIFNEQHNEIRRTVAKFVENEINPHVDEWEEAGIFPAHELFKKMGDLGLLGISKPEEYGGLGLDYSYEMVFAEELGAIGAIGLILLMSYLVIQLLRLGWQELQRGRHFAGYVCLFVGLLFAFQFLVNIGVNTGALPTKGLTLPFVSYGGNSLIISCALMGLVLRSVTSDTPIKKRGAS